MAGTAGRKKVWLLVKLTVCHTVFVSWMERCVQLCNLSFLEPSGVHQPAAVWAGEGAVWHQLLRQLRLGRVSFMVSQHVGYMWRNIFGMTSTAHILRGHLPGFLCLQLLMSMEVQNTYCTYKYLAFRQVMSLSSLLAMPWKKPGLGQWWIVRACGSPIDCPQGDVQFLQGMVWLESLQSHCISVEKTMFLYLSLYINMKKYTWHCVTTFQNPAFYTTANVKFPTINTFFWSYWYFRNGLTNWKTDLLTNKEGFNCAPKNLWES